MARNAKQAAPAFGTQAGMAANAKTARETAAPVRIEVPTPAPATLAGQAAADATPAAPRTKIAAVMAGHIAARATTGRPAAPRAAVQDAATLTPATGGQMPAKRAVETVRPGTLYVGKGNTPAPSGTTGQGGAMAVLDRLLAEAGVGARGAVCFTALIEALPACVDATIFGGETRACTNSAKGNRAPDGGNTGPFTVYLAPTPAQD